MVTPFGIEENLCAAIESTIDQTNKEIVKGEIVCTGCGESKEKRIEDIYELATWAEDHAIEAWEGSDIYDHHVGFDVDLIPLPDIKELTANVEVGKVNE